MGSNPHALFSRLSADLSVQIDRTSLDRIKGGDTMWPGMTYHERAAASIWGSLLKKREGALDLKTKQKALDKFLQVNSACEKWVFTDSEMPCDDILLGETKRLIHRFWSVGHLASLVEHPYDILSRGKVGPGAARGSIGGDFFTKLFSSKMSVTSQRLYNYYRYYIRAFPEWANAEETRKLNFGMPDIVEGNRLDFVPKNDDIARSICVEPSLNMFFQLGFGEILTSRLESLWGIDLKRQQFKNRVLAQIGSREGSFATIDLSSASDSISCAMLRWLLPSDFYQWLDQLRSRTSILPNGKQTVLHMISTMGNGFTFPLQTIIFTAVVLAAMSLDELAPIYPHGDSCGNFGVNGDDIVIPTRLVGKVCRLLKLLGFTTNSEKTFVEGPFKESCGGDYFEGRDLRGVYIKRLSGPHDYYSVINQLNLFSTKTGLFLPKLVQYLLSQVKLRPVPRWESESSGIRLPLALAKPFLREDRNTGSILYRAWSPDPPPTIRVGDWLLMTPRGYKPRQFNSSGLFLSVLQGSVSASGIPLIPKQVRWRTKSRIAPNWDYMPSEESNVRTVPPIHGGVDWGRWESVAYFNLIG